MKLLGKMSGVWVLAVILGLTGASCAVQATTDHRPPATSEPDVATEATIQAAYGKLPLHFEANQGQSDPQVKFLSRGSGYTLFLTPTEAVLALRQQSAVSGQQSALKTQDSRFLSPPPDAGEGQGEGAVLHMKLVGTNPSPQVASLDELPGKVNYFLGDDSKNWHTNIPTYARVQYKDIYPGIDLIYYGNQRQLSKRARDWLPVPYPQ